MELNGETNENSFFPRQFLSLDYSFGYDCKRFYNLAVINGDTLLHVTGRFIHFYDISSGQLCYSKPLNDGNGIGHITTHPINPQFAVGEKGTNPPIVIYDWPSLQIVQVMQNGAEKGFRHLTYSPNGELLASLSSNPDYLLIVWSWAKGEILLRSKAFNHDVYQITFSLFNSNQLATCGVNHLKLWETSETFTGLKLLGQLCRFGKTDSCNLIGALPLPDGSCATGSVWGNILIWLDGSVHFEIFRIGRLPCHSAPITQLHFHTNAIMTAGLDGAIRLWNYEDIEMADVSDQVLEMEPLFEFNIKETQICAEVMCLVKALPEPESTVWYAQASNGAAWSLDISMHVKAKPPKRVFWSHAGAVVALQSSPAGSLFATLGEDSKIMVFDYDSKKLEAFLEFPSAGTCLLWVPLSVAPSGSILITGFSDGVLRVLSLSNQKLQVLQEIKPHTLSITDVVLGAQFILTGSEDSTIFLIRINSSFELSPIGFCELKNSPSCLCWDSNDSFLVGCKNGEILIYNFENYVTENDTFRLKVEPQIFKVTNSLQKIIFLLKSPKNSLWFAVDNDDYETASLFEYDFLNSGVSILTQIDCCVCCVCYWPLERCLFLGLSDGTISVLRFNAHGQISSDRWSCGVHDSNRGAIRQLVISWDNRRLFSCGDDGGVFSFLLNGFDHPVPENPTTIPYITPKASLDFLDPTAFSLEEAKIKENTDKRSQHANESRKRVLAEINQLRIEYQTIHAINDDLPVEVGIPKEDLILDSRVVEDFRKSLDEEKNLVYRKIARDTERSEKLLKKLENYFLGDLETLVTRVEAINTKCFVETVRITKIGEDFYRDLEAVQEIAEETDKQGSAQEAPKPPDVAPAARADSPDTVDALVKQVSTLGDVSRNRKLAALCRQHRARRAAAAARSVIWENHMRRKPDPDRSDPKDLTAVEIAKETFGDYKLKTSPEYKVPKHRNVNTINKYKALLEARLRIHKMNTEFNDKVFCLRKRKKEMLENHTVARGILTDISKEIPLDLVKIPPKPIEINPKFEYPENSYTLTELDIDAVLPEKLRKSVIVDKQPVSIIDMEYEILLAEAKKPCDVLPCEITEMQSAVSVCDSVETAWETEMREMRMVRKCKEQNKIMHQMLDEITKFDDDVAKLSEEKINLQVDAKYLELHLLMLHREILVLKAFEEDEQEKSRIAFKLLTEQRDLQIAMNQVTAEMEKKVAEIQGHETEGKTIITNFLESITESKYYEYLKRIFKKKFKPPKKGTSDGGFSSSESSSDSDDQEDDKSIDSKELNLMKLNENVCPVGCDVADYERTFKSRSERHCLEQKISDKRKCVDGLKKKFDALTKLKIKIESDYAKAEESFDNLQREKQVKLNEIETVVVLRLSQLQNFNSACEMEEMDDSLILSGQLMTQLYNRVEELSREAVQQKEKHELNKQHLTRMTLDIRHMTSVTSDLENQIQQSMFRKFGMNVNLDELEESLVKKLIAEMNFIPFQVQQKLERRLRLLQERLRERVDAYASRMSENTKRYNILAILKDESCKLEDALVKQEAKKCLPLRLADTSDLDHLAEIVKRQEGEVARLKEEIFGLKSKTRPHSSRQFGLREMSEMALIRGPDGEYQEISLTVRNRLSNMLPQIQQYRANTDDPHSKTRLKKHVEEFMEDIPERALRSVWEEISQGRYMENLSDMLESSEILLKATDVMIEMIETIIPGIGDNLLM